MNKDGKTQGVSHKYFFFLLLFITDFILHDQGFKKGRQIWWRIDGYFGEVLVTIIEKKDNNGSMWYKVQDFEKGVYWAKGKDLKFERPSDKW